MLDDLDASVLQILRGVRELVLSDVLTDTEKVAKIGALVEPEQIAETESRALRASLLNDAVDGHYFDILETRSVRLQNQVAGILKSVAFQATPNAVDLEVAIAHFVATDGALDRTAPAEFLAADERAAVWKGDKFRISLYKVLLFQHVASAIKSGSLNLERSHRRRRLEAYLIDKTRWLAERAQLLDRAGMTGFTDPAPVLEELDAALQTRFLDTNRAISAGLNSYLKVTGDKAFRIATPSFVAGKRRTDFAIIRGHVAAQLPLLKPKAAENSVADDKFSLRCEAPPEIEIACKPIASIESPAVFHKLSRQNVPSC